MDMNSEFINVYIEKMRAVITDMQSKILLLETDQHFKQKRIEELSVALDNALKNQKPSKKVIDNNF